MDSDPWLPTGEEQAEIGRVGSLLYEVVYLPANAELDAVFNPVQFLVQPENAQGTCKVEIEPPSFTIELT